MKEKKVETNKQRTKEKTFFSENPVTKPGRFVDLFWFCLLFRTPAGAFKT